ncbi:MAG: HipA domain-containing protein [Muribaculaceae bacterium]|nr:HipA domain-containing protein [Muribaculaceae bacterium]
MNVCASTLQPGYDGYSPAAIKRLFGGVKTSPVIEIDFDKDANRDDVASNIARISVSGVQEKMSALVDKGKIRLCLPNEQSTHILKPAPLDYDLRSRHAIPANEHLTMQIASQAFGIVTAENGLCFDLKGRSVYITKRFDLQPDGSKTQMEDFAALIGKTEAADGKHFKYEGCYEDIAVAIKRFVAAWPIAVERFFNLVVFNYIYGNGDAHLKNFSLQRINGEFLLAPAYDLLNTALHIDGDDLALKGGLLRSGWRSEAFDRTGHPCREDFEAFGQHIGVRGARLTAILDSYTSIPEKALQLVEHSFLDNKNKRSYIRIVEERISRFKRMS